jgi:hypothetical protein
VLLCKQKWERRALCFKRSICIFLLFWLGWHFIFLFTFICFFLHIYRNANNSYTQVLQATAKWWLLICYVLGKMFLSKVGWNVNRSAHDPVFLWIFIIPVIKTKKRFKTDLSAIKLDHLP